MGTIFLLVKGGVPGSPFSNLLGLKCWLSWSFLAQTFQENLSDLVSPRDLVHTHFSRALGVGTKLVSPQVHGHVGFKVGQDYLLFMGMGHVSTHLIVKTFSLNHKGKH